MKSLLTGLLLAAGAMGAVAAQGGLEGQLDLRDWQQSETRGQDASHGEDSRNGATSRAGAVDGAETRRDSERLRGPGAPAPAGSGGSDHRDSTGVSEGSSPHDVPGSPRATGN